MPMQGRLFPTTTPSPDPPRRGWSSTDGATLSFGRFAGRPLRALPGWYLAWLLDQTWTAAPLRAALKREWARRGLMSTSERQGG